MNGETPFDDDTNNKISDLITEKNKSLILTLIISHPKYSISKKEMDYFIPEPTITELMKDVRVLQEYNLVKWKETEVSEEDEPNKFLMLTGKGVKVLSENGFLNTLPVMRAVFDSTRKTKEIQKHIDSDRPQLEDEVKEKISLSDGVMI